MAITQEKIYYKYLKTLSCSEAQAVNELHKLSDELSIKPGQKLCHDCFNASNSAYSTHLNLTPVDRNELDDSYHDRDVDIECLNEGIAMLGCSPVNFRKVSERDVVGYGKWKIKQVQLSTDEKITHLLGSRSTDILRPISSPSCEKCKDMDGLVKRKSKYHPKSNPSSY